MEVSNRVLTVSYGTFSCSLEGFDDPFSTLQQVAEYFRKLSAEDRFFGGEPQVPDNNAIHKIAEAANPNRVNAEVKDDGIVLRQSAEPDLELTTSDIVEPEDAEKTAEQNNSRQKNKNRKNRNKNKSQNKKSNSSEGNGSVFRSRRHRAEDHGSDTSVENDSQHTVEETLAKIRRNVEEAEDEIIRSEDAVPAPTLVLDTEEITEDAPATQDAKAVEEIKADAAFEEAIADLEPPNSSETVPEAPSTTVVSLSDALDQDDGDKRASASSLSAEEENDLAAALDGSSRDPEEEAEAAKIKKRRQRRRDRAEALRNNNDIAREDEALDRLLKTTKTQMEAPESSRRKNALNQLKAAVAATEADAGSNEDSQEELDELAAYREDLLKAQRKSQGSRSRPQGSGRSSGGGTPTSAPLILVSEQRIDAPEETPTPEADVIHREAAEIDGNLALQQEPVAPETEIKAGIPASAFQESSSFRDFADQIGAVTLQDMLEAAAAYTSIVEGKPRFSRAQVMSKLAKISTSDAFSKEAGLRSFGKLLREGKILRVQDGQFAISKSSRFSIASRYGT